MKKYQNTSWKRFKPVENLENFNETKVSGSQNIFSVIKLLIKIRIKCQRRLKTTCSRCKISAILMHKLILNTNNFVCS